MVRLSERILELTANTDATVSRIWLGPIHIEALLILERYDEARERLKAYAQLVAECKSPHFNREAESLARLIS